MNYIVQMNYIVHENQTPHITMQSRVFIDTTCHILDEEGKIWSCGHSEQKEGDLVPRIMEWFAAPIQTVYNGFNCSYFIDIDGDVWLLRRENTVTIPRKMSFPTQIKDVAVCFYFTAFLTFEGKVLMDPGVTPPTPPQLVGVQVNTIKAGYLRMAFLDADGCIWMFKNIDSRIDQCLEKYEHSCRIVEIHVGYKKIVFKDEEHFVWHCGPSGNFGLGNIAEPTSGFEKMHENPMKMVSVSENHAIMLDFDNQVWTSSYYEHFQIGEKSHYKKSSRLLNIPPIQMVCAAYGHNLLLDHCGIVWEIRGSIGSGRVQRKEALHKNQNSTTNPSCDGLQKIL